MALEVPIGKIGGTSSLGPNSNKDENLDYTKLQLTSWPCQLSMGHKFE